MAVLVEVRGLRIRFGVAEAVRGIDLHIDEGEVLGLVGESGSGKSATALAMMGLLGSTARVEGKIEWRRAAAERRSGADDGETAIDLLRQPPGALRRLRGREIAMIFQEPMTALNPVMTIGRQVAEAVTAHQPSLTGKEARRKAIAALEAVAIPEAALRYGDYPHQFSGGQRQRILIAMALDVTVQAQVLELLGELQRRHGLAMLFISHDLAVVGRVASRVAVMRAGLVVETGASARLLTVPEHEYTRSLLAAVPTLRTDRERPLAVVK